MASFICFNSIVELPSFAFTQNLIDFQTDSIEMYFIQQFSVKKNNQKIKTPLSLVSQSVSLESYNVITMPIEGGSKDEFRVYNNPAPPPPPPFPPLKFNANGATEYQRNTSLRAFAQAVHTSNL